MFTQIIIWRTFPSLLPGGSRTVRPSWNLGFSVCKKTFFSRIFLDLVKYTVPTCRQTPHAFTYPGLHSQKPHSQWVCAGQPYSHSFLSKSFFSSSTGFQCLLEFTSDNCWGSSYPSSRRRRRSTHDDEGNSGGGGIGGGTICISGTWSQSQTENQKSMVWWPRYHINLKLLPVVNAVGGKIGAITKGWASNKASTLVIKRDKLLSVDQVINF